MKTRLFLPVIATGSFAAIAFAAGRLSVATAEHDIIPAVLNKETSALNRPADRADSAPPNLRDISLRPFDQIYLLLKTAPPELLQRYADDLARISSRPKRWAVQIQFFKALIHANPAAARDFILRLEKQDRWTAMMAVRDAAPPRAMKEIVEIMLTYKPGEISGCSYDLLRDTVDDWAKNDPLALKEFIESHPGGKMDYFDVLVRNWSAYDPDGALNWINRLLGGQIRTFDGAGKEVDWSDAKESMVASWMEGFVQNDRSAAVEYLIAHRDEPETGAAFSVAGRMLFAESPQEARNFILQLPPERQAEVLEGVMGTTARFRRGAADEAQSSPEFVANWVLQFPPETWSEGISNVLSEWRYKDARGLLDWMADLPLESRQPVVRSFHIYLTSESVDEDLGLLMGVRDVSLRDQLLDSLMSEATIVRSELIAALGRTQLTPEQRARLVALIPEDTSTVEVVDLEE